MTLFSDVLSIPSNPEDFFTLINPIGSGAFGHVYKAMHNQSKKIYAIKIVQYFKDDIDYINNNNHIDNINFCYKTVQQETSLMRLVNSSNYILKYYGSYFSRKTNTLWLIIEYCSYGSTIDLMLAMDRNYTEIELATIIKMILNGLILIHEKNLIHRDIKGANILLSEEGFAKLGDFGVGVELKEKYRTSKKGSPYWMSPQVIKQEKYDYKTDIWSLGITCIELLQGDPPYSTLSPEEVMKKIGNKMFKFEDFFGGEKSKYSKEFQNFLSRCLNVNPKKRANAKELIKHPFILKYAKDNLFLKNILIKHKNDIEIYRKELEEFENQMKNNIKNKDGLKINNNYSLNSTVKKENIFNNSKNSSKKKKILESIKKKENCNIEFNENNSFFKYLNLKNNIILSTNFNPLSYFSSRNELSKRKSDLNSSDDLNISNMIININKYKMNTNSIEKKFKIENNSFVGSEKKKMTKSRNSKEIRPKELKDNNKLYFTKNEYMFDKNKKCQIISFRMSMKKSLSEKKKYNDQKKNNIIYSKKIILDQGKHRMHCNNEITKINSYKNIKSTNSNINTDFNTDNFSNTNNSHSFIMNSLSLKNIFNKTIKNENIKNLKNKIQTLSHFKNNNICYENNNLYNGIVTDYNASRISTRVNNISNIEQIPSLNLDKILYNNNNMDQKLKNLDYKEENIFDFDDDGIINKINNCKLNVKNFQDKENINKLNFYHNNDTINSYSILDSKDSVISIMPINSSNKNLDETHRKYFV